MTKDYDDSFDDWERAEEEEWMRDDYEDEINLLNAALDQQISSQTGWDINDPKVKKKKEALIKSLKEGKGDENKG